MNHKLGLDRTGDCTRSVSIATPLSQAHQCVTTRQPRGRRWRHTHSQSIPAKPLSAKRLS